MVKTKHIRTALAMRAMRRRLAHPLKTKSLINFKFTRTPLTKVKGVLFKLKNNRLITRSTLKQRLSATTLFATTIMLVISLILPGINARAAQTLTWSSNADFAFNKASKCQATNIDKLTISGSSYTDSTCASSTADSDLTLAPDESDLQNIKSISSGNTFSLALSNDGTVWAWGYNYYGQLGDGTVTNSLFPVHVKDSSGTGYLSDIIAVSAGGDHSMALKNDGTVWTWGSNRRDQLGDDNGGSTGDYSALPVQVKSASGGYFDHVTKINAGTSASMAIKDDGTVWTWGYGNNGLLGQGMSYSPNLPGRVRDAAGTGYLSDVKAAVFSHYYSAMALKNDGTVWTWGVGSSGQLGDGTTTANAYLPVQVKSPDGSSYLTEVNSIGAADYMAYVVKNDGTVWAWGTNSAGQLGNGSNTQSLLPTQVKDGPGTGFLAGITSVIGGSNHGVALKNDGTVWSWGSNANGQFGNNTTTGSNLPVQAKEESGTGFLGNVKAIDASNSQTLVLTEEGRVLGMGLNANGQLGYRYYAYQSSLPASVVAKVEEKILDNVISVSAASFHSMVLKSDGTVWAWGNNAFGRLGDGTTTTRLVPVQVKDETGTGYLTGVTAIAASNYHSLALKNDGSVWAWGNNGNGQLGNGTNNDSILPVRVKSATGGGYLSGITAIAAGSNYSIALKDDGTVWAWGYNYYGQIGDGNSGSYANRSLPTQVKDSSGTGYLTGVTAIAAGTNHSIALRGDGTVWAWGYNYYGQIGDGSSGSTNRLLPVQVKDSTGTGVLSNMTQVAVGDSYSMALKNDGTVWSWGYNNYGRLGDGTTTNKLLPVQVKDASGTGWLTNVTKITLGSSHSLALKNDGTVWSWGYTRYGRIGDGTAGSSPYTAPLPIQVKDPSGTGVLSGITAISSGATHSLVLKQDTKVLAWGRNDSQQLGSGNYLETNPLPIVVLSEVNYMSGYAESGSLSGLVFDIGQGKKTKWYGVNWTTDALPANTSVKFNVRTSNDAETWSEWTQDFTQNSAGSTAGDGDISTLPLSRYIELKATLATTDNSVTPKLNDFSLSYLEDTVAPETNAANIVLKRSSSGSTVTDGGWINNQTPYFSWDSAVDVSGGAGIQGYCLYLGQDTTADFEQTDGILGDSPLDTGGACRYATENNYLDLSQSGVLASELQTDNNPYYLLVKAIDYGANIYEGAAASFSFNYDATPPTNPMFISAPSQFVSTKDVTLTWPNSGLQGPLDSDSQIAGLQYRIGSSGSWYGESHNGNEDLTDLLANDGNYQTVEEFDYDLLNEGNNIVYFRTLDRAGNVSTSYITAVIKINTSSPSQPLNVTATPSTSTSNSFAFSWHQPATFVGPANGITYCYTVNALPNSNNCSWTKPGQASLSADAYATQPDENIFYVVAKDEAGNINYATYGSVSFTAKTEAPGLPRNFEIADVSTKASETWKIALSWTTPADAGAGVAKYVIYRSTDGTAYSQIATTTGQSYVDGPLAQREYFYQIRACDSANKCGADTEPLSMTPTGRYTTPPELISSVNSEVSTRRASFTWATDRNSDSRIQYGTESGVYMAGEVTVSEPTKSHAVELLGLDAGTTYYYKVKWTDEDGNTGISSELTFTTKPAPVVKDVQVVKKTLNSALIQFTSTDAAKVSIQYGQSENFGGIKTINTSLTESTYIVELVGLNDGTTYFYKLNTFDSEGNQYDSRRIDTFATPQRPRISNLRFQPVQGEPTSTQKVTWTTNVPTTSTITYGKNGSNGSDIYLSALTTDHVVTVRGLEDDSQYFLLAQSRDADGNLAVSDRQLFRTALDTRPPKLSDVLIETSVKGNGSEARGQIVVSWKTDEPATSQVAYADGSGGNYTSRTAEDMRLTTEHVVIISDLSVSKVYHLQPISSDRADNETGGDDQSAIIGRASDSVLNIILNSLYRIFGL